MRQPTAKPTIEALVLEHRMKAIGRAVNWRTPAGYEFLVLIFPSKGNLAQIAHVTDASQEDAINALKTFLVQAGAKEGDWSKHV